MHHVIQMKPVLSEKSNAIEDRKLFIEMVLKTSNESDIRVIFSPFGNKRLPFDLLGCVRYCICLMDSGTEHNQSHVSVDHGGLLFIHLG